MPPEGPLACPEPPAQAPAPPEPRGAGRAHHQKPEAFIERHSRAALK